MSAAQAAVPDDLHPGAGVPALQVVRDAMPPDVAAATRAARALLEALGLDTAAEGMADTPGRMARAYAELFTARPFAATTFPNDEGYDELVLARAIPLRSVCEHHLLPFTGVAHVGYLPGGRILGLSKLARLVEHYAARPQVQERLTQQVADWLHHELDAKGVGVVLEAEHTCMTLRGVQAVGARTVTSALRGVLRDSPSSRAEFFALTGVAADGGPLERRGAEGIGEATAPDHHAAVAVQRHAGRDHVVLAAPVGPEAAKADEVVVEAVAWSVGRYRRQVDEQIGPIAGAQLLKAQKAPPVSQLQGHRPAGGGVAERAEGARREDRWLSVRRSGARLTRARVRGSRGWRRRHWQRLVDPLVDQQLLRLEPGDPAGEGEHAAGQRDPR